MSLLVNGGEKASSAESNILKFASRDASGAQPYAFPVTANLLRENVASDEEAARLGAATFPVAPAELRPLLDEFLKIKRESGTPPERELYTEDKDAAWLVTRLATKRPLVFMNANDTWLLRDGTEGRGGWESIGTEDEEAPLVLAEYLSYDEIALSALVGVSAETYLINRGDRFNRGKRSDDCVASATYVGLVGTRFERPGLMEWRHCVVDDTEQENTPLRTAWARFYGLDKFPTFEDATSEAAALGAEENDAEESPRFVPLTEGAFLDTLVYKRRVAKTARVFLREANERAREAGKKAYAHVVGLGLGVWQVHPAQNDLFVDAVLAELPSLDLPHVSDVDFSWILSPARARDRPGLARDNSNSTVALHFSKRDPFAKLLTGGGDEDDSRLVVAMFAWDANSYPGNEYWLGSLSGSGDPAAAACSAVGELLNPDVNPAALQGQRTRWY